MEKFTARNGLRIAPHRDGSVRWEAGFSPTVVTAALREFFLHERDQELGRWRWPENPNYVVYPDRAKKFIEQPAVIVVNERDGATAYCGKDGAYSASGIGASDAWCEPAASAYFAAHPEPKPWHEAKHGEVWVVTYQGKEQAVISSGRYFTWPHGSQQRHDDPDITAGRRIYPEASDD